MIFNYINTILIGSSHEEEYSRSNWSTTSRIRRPKAQLELTVYPLGDCNCSGSGLLQYGAPHGAKTQLTCHRSTKQPVRRTINLLQHMLQPCILIDVATLLGHQPLGTHSLRTARPTVDNTISSARCQYRQFLALQRLT